MSETLTELTFQSLDDVTLSQGSRELDQLVMLYIQPLLTSLLLPNSVQLLRFGRGTALRLSQDRTGLDSEGTKKGSGWI